MIYWSALPLACHSDIMLAEVASKSYPINEQTLGWRRLYQGRTSRRRCCGEGQIGSGTGNNETNPQKTLAGMILLRFQEDHFYSDLHGSATSVQHRRESHSTHILHGVWGGSSESAEPDFARSPSRSRSLLRIHHPISTDSKMLYLSDSAFLRVLFSKAVLVGARENRAFFSPA